MSSAKWIIFLCGFYSIGFALFHIFFWRLFDWKNDLKKLTTANRAIIQIANLRLIYFFLLVAFLCFTFPTELVTTPLGRCFLLGVSLFWLGRMVEQFIFLSVKSLIVHGLTILFALGVLLFALPLL